MMFQFHVTLNAVTPERQDLFLALCERSGVKPVLIRLSKGEHVDQPMITAMQQAENLDEALRLMEAHLLEFADHGFRIVRTKAEIDPARNEDYLDERNYYEWHGLVRCDDDEALRRVCESLGAHLSRNALIEGQKFITVRIHDKDEFYRSVGAIASALRRADFVLLKEKFEYSVHDSSIELDKGWA